MKPRRETAMRTFCAVAILGVAGVSAAVMYWAEGEASAVIIGTVALLLAVFVTYRIRHIWLYNKIFTKGREMVA